MGCLLWSAMKKGSLNKVFVPRGEGQLTAEICRQVKAELNADKSFYPDLSALVTEGRRSGLISFSFEKGKYEPRQLSMLEAGLKTRFTTTNSFVGEFTDKAGKCYDTVALRIPIYRFGVGGNENETSSSYEEEFVPAKIKDII